MHGGYSGFETKPTDGVVLYNQAEVLRSAETQSRKPEAFSSPVIEHSPQTVQTALPPTVLGHERLTSTNDREAARHAAHASAVILDLRDGAVNYNMQKQGLSQQESRYAA